MVVPAKTFEDLDKICDDASTAFEVGQFEKARALYLEVLSSYDGLMDDGYRISIRQYLGVSCYRLEDFKEAARYDRQTLELLGGKIGTKVNTLRHNLARDLSAIHDQDPANSLDRLNEAIALHRENLQALQKSSRTKEELLETKYSLAFDLAKLSKSTTDDNLAGTLLEEAAKLDRQVLEVRAKSDPADPLTLQSRHNLASVLYYQENYSEAKRLFLYNQGYLDSLSSREKKQQVVLRQSTDRHLAACCEATKDINLSISRITAEYHKLHKSFEATNKEDKSSKPRKADAAKPNVYSNAEPGGKLWNLPVESNDINAKEKHMPTGLSPPVNVPKINEPLAGKPASANYSGIATSGSSRNHLGNSYNTTNVYNYFNSPAPGTISYDHGPLLQEEPSLSLQPPNVQQSGIKRSSSQGHQSRKDSSLQPDPGKRPRSASSVRADDLTTQQRGKTSKNGPGHQSDSVNQELGKSEHQSTTKDATGHSRSLSGSSGNDERAQRGRRARSSESQTPQRATSLSSQGPSRSQSSSSRPTSRCKPEKVTKPRKTEAVTHKADQWFVDLQGHTHTLLHYGDQSKISTRRRVRVAIIDSGIDLPQNATVPRADIQRHKNRVRRCRNFTSETSSFTDSSSSFHGTNCASILLQVAPHADLYVANVVRKSTGIPSPSAVSAALEWALTKEVDIISMSLGFDQMHEDIKKQIDFARLKGVLIFAAASNDGPNAPDWGVFPAWLSSVFCINSANTSGAMSWFNPKNTDEKLNFMFLGEEIALLSEDGTPVPNLPRLTGTSFATPIAAGTAALVLDLVRMQNIEKDFPKVESCLKTYEGMSAVFKKMSSPPTAFGNEFYNVRPWRLLGRKGPPLSRANEPNESKQWYTLMKVVDCLAKFGDLDTGVDALSAELSM